MQYHEPSPLGPARPSVADIEVAKPTIRSLGKLGKPFSFVLNQCPRNRSIRTMDGFRALQLMSGVSDVTPALRADHVDCSGAGAGSDRARYFGHGRDPIPRAAHVGHLTNGRGDL